MALQCTLGIPHACNHLVCNTIPVNPIESREKPRIRVPRFIELAAGALGVAGSLYVTYHAAKYGSVVTSGTPWSDPDFCGIDFLFGVGLTGTVLIDGAANLRGSPSQQEARRLASVDATATNELSAETS